MKLLKDYEIVGLLIKEGEVELPRNDLEYEIDMIKSVSNMLDKYDIDLIVEENKGATVFYIE